MMDAEPIATAAIERAKVPVDGVFNLLDVIAFLGAEIFRDKGGERLLQGSFEPHEMRVLLERCSMEE